MDKGLKSERRKFLSTHHPVRPELMKGIILLCQKMMSNSATSINVHFKKIIFFNLTLTFIMYDDEDFPIVYNIKKFRRE